MSEQLKKFKLKWVKYEGWSWVGEEPVDAFVHEYELVRAEDADALAERLAECEAALQFYADQRSWLSVKDEAEDEVEGLIHSSDLEAIGLWDFGGKMAREYFKKYKPAP